MSKSLKRIYTVKFIQGSDNGSVDIEAECMYTLPEGFIFKDYIEESASFKEVAFIRKSEVSNITSKNKG